MKVKIKVSVSIRWRESQKVIRKFQITVNDGNFTFFLSSDNKMIRMYRVALRRIFIAMFSFEFFFFFRETVDNICSEILPVLHDRLFQQNLL